MKKEIKKILNNGTVLEKKALFSFTREDNPDRIYIKFNLWSRYFFPKYFESKDAKFHRDIDLYNIGCYVGSLDFVNIAFRGAAKTARTKLFIAYAIANDLEHFRKYIKVLSHDGINSRQIVTDIYNMFKLPEIVEMYSEIFEKTNTKKEETMSSFTTTTGVKVLADTVGTDQRGALQENVRPDLVWFEDFENRVTLRSRIKTKAIWDNMEEARTGLAKHGSCIYTCNYISESGNVHKLVEKSSERHKVLITSIIDKDGFLTWPERYTEDDVQYMRETDDDFAGERLCKPSHSDNLLFDRVSVEELKVMRPLKEVAGVRLYSEFDPSHRYGGGQDIAGGVGLDSSTSIVIDFETVPAKVVLVYENNKIKPDVFAYEIQRHSEMFGDCLMAPERNNHGHATIAILKQLNVDMYVTEGKDTRIVNNQTVRSQEYGWYTNAVSKPKMLMSLAKAINDGLLEVYDEQIINELKSYTRDDLIETVNDPRLVTRHYDLLIALAIAWQMKDYATNKAIIRANNRIKSEKRRKEKKNNILR